MRVKEMTEREREVLEKAEEHARLLGWEIVDVSIVGQRRSFIVRVTLDKPGGISILDCERFSKDIESAIEELFIGEGRYYLEVSSPGIERELKREREIHWACGKQVKAMVVEGDQVLTYEGELVEYRHPRLHLYDEAYGDIELELEKIKLLRLKSEPFVARNAEA